MHSRLHALLIVILIGMGLLGCYQPVQAQAKKPATMQYYDVYLVNNQVCRKCAILLLGNTQDVMLQNQAGQSVVVRGIDIEGVDTQPKMRKFLTTMVDNLGLPTSVICPQGYDPLQSWRNGLRQRPLPTPINYPEGATSY